MTASSQRRVSLLLGVAGIVVLLGLFWRFGFDELLQTLSRARLSLLVLYAVLAVIVVVLHAWRWRYLAPTIGGSVPLSRFVAARIAGDAVGTLVPSARLGGDPIRVALLYGEGGTGTDAFAGVTIDRVIETIGNTACTIVYVLVFLLAGGSSSGRGPVLWFAAVMSVPLIAFAVHFAAMRRGAEPIRRILSRPRLQRPGLVSRGAAVLVRIEGHLVEIVRRQPRRFAIGLAVMAITQVFIVAMYEALLRAFEVNLPLPVLLMSLLASGFARAVPTPASLGSLEAAQVGMLSLTGNSPELGLVVGILMRLHDTIWTAVGIVILMLRGVSLSRGLTPREVPTVVAATATPLREQVSQRESF